MLNNLGNSLVELKQLDEAIVHLQEAVRFKPDYISALNNLGRSLYEAGQFEDAIETYKRIIEIDPAYYTAYNRLGATYQGLGQFENAEKFFQKAISVKPDYSSAHLNLSILCNYERDDPHLAEMKSLLSRSNLKDIDREQLNYAIAGALDKAGEFEQAFEHFVAGNKLRKNLLGYDISRDQKSSKKCATFLNRRLNA